jgi:hypothetical protein
MALALRSLDPFANDPQAQVSVVAAAENSDPRRDPPETENSPTSLPRDDTHL